MWTKAGLAWVASVAMPSDPEAFRREVLLAELEHFEMQIQRVTEQLDRLAQRHPGVRLLMTTPGVGPRTAEGVVADIDAPDRRKIAVVGLAHKLLRMMLAMLRSGETCRWQATA